MRIPLIPLIKIDAGRTTDPCPMTGSPHRWKWYGTQTHRCDACGAFVWFLHAALNPGERPNVVNDREVFRLVEESERS
jgi:hypothetical protein